MTYKKIIDNYRWDRLVRDLYRQLGNKTKNDDLNYVDENGFENVWQDIYENEMMNLKEALSLFPDLSDEMYNEIINRFELSYKDNKSDAYIIWKRK